jgi:carboxypeptidase PM20D1
MKKFLLVTLFFFACLIAFLAFRTFTFRSRQLSVAPVAKIPVSDSAKFHLTRAIQIKTISPEDPADFDSAQFYAFREFLKKTYPLTQAQLKPLIVNEFSFLYKWPGSDPNLQPVILMGHLDVVPVAEESLKDWKATPFGGEIKDGIIWGRGAIDDKMSVIGILEATEMLLKSNFKPRQTIYLAFGHDEETGGRKGAQSLVKQLQKEKVKAAFVLDEGYAITQKLVPGLAPDVALIGISEKGFASLELSAQIEGGHSSMPKNETAIDLISGSILKLRANPFEARITPPVHEFIKNLGPEMPLVQKLAFANSRLMEPLILKTYQKTPSGNALVNTTMAPTIFKSGIKDNVIPAQASAVINFRILPGTTINEVISYVKTTLNDNRISIKLRPFSSEASAVSGTETAGYKALNKTIKQLFPEALTSPSMVVAATDSRFYYAISPNVYRFLPYHINKDNLSTFHGTNEHIAVKEFEDAIRFYNQLIRNLGN